MKLSSRAREGRPAAPWALACLVAACLVAGLAACAQSPTELVVFASVDATVTRPITSILVTVTGAQSRTSRVFQSLSAPAPDADIPVFYFPTSLDLQLTRDGISGPVQIDVAGSDPTIDDTLIATGSVAATLPANQTTKVSVVLTAAPPATAGAAGAAGAGGAGGARGAGGAGGAGGDGAAGGAGGA